MKLKPEKNSGLNFPLILLIGTEPHACIETESMVNMASGMDRRCGCPTTKNDDDHVVQHGVAAMVYSAHI